MLNRLHLLFLFCLVSFCVSAQMIRLQKNGTLKTIELHLHEKYSILYKSDAGLVSYKGKASDYDFPYLVLKRKSDTIVIDVRKIEEIRFTSDVLPLCYIGIFLNTDLSIALFSDAVTNSVTHSNYKELSLILIPTSITYLLIKAAYRKLNTKTEWHFY